MKNRIFLLCIFLSINLIAQNNAGKLDDVGRIALTAFVPKQAEGLPPAVKSSLSNKLVQIITSNGLGNSSASRFILTANVNVSSKDITPTAPPMHAYNLDVTLYIGDGIDGTLFASQNITLKGVGANETKAYTSALNNLKPKDASFQAFIEKGKTKIVEYYNTKCDFILKEAQNLSTQNKYDDALVKLGGVPEVCKLCYTKSSEAIVAIYQKKINSECKSKLSEAVMAWNSSQNSEGATLAGDLLSQIKPESSCFNEASELASNIAKRIKELEQRDWDFKMKQNQDATDITKLNIEAVKDANIANEKKNSKIEYNIDWW